MAGAGKDVAQALANRRVDLALVSGETASSGTARTPLFEDELLFVMSLGHRHAKRAYIEGQDIVGETFIAFAKTPEPARGSFGCLVPGERRSRVSLRVIEVRVTTRSPEPLYLVVSKANHRRRR